MAIASLAAATAWACGPFEVKPRDFVVYRLPQPAQAQPNDMTQQRDSASLQAWCELAGDSVTPGDVAQVMRLPRITAAALDSAAVTNAFAGWLLKHRDALQCLTLAKQCELTRQFMQDPWYYPDTENDDILAIEQIEALARQHDPAEVQGRYALIAVRAMMSQRAYERCVQYLDSVQASVTCEAVRALIEPYLAGCQFHLGNHEKALLHFIRLGDVQSAEYCAMKMDAELLDYASANPELPVFAQLLADYLLRLDIDMRYGPNEWRSTNPDIRQAQCQRRRDICLAVADKHPANEAMWLYAAAAMSDALNQVSSAVALCDRALTARGHQPLADHLRVLRFYIQARTMPVGAHYDAMVQRGVRLLAGLTERDQQQFRDFLSIDPYLELSSREGVIGTYHNVTNYYWHNMLNRIVVGTVVPRLVTAGKTTQALLLSNMAENYLVRLMHADSLMQRYDNATFTLADTLPTAAVRHYRQVVAHPRNAHERWLVAHAYNDDDYWNELLGTKCLRTMDYRGAVGYLRQVSHDYQRSMNIWPYLTHDPMRYRTIAVTDRCDYKLHFAQRMLAAQQAACSADPNTRADGLMLLATGLANAIRDYETGEDARCWALLRYSTSDYWYEYGDHNAHVMLDQYKLIDRYRRRAYSTFTDRERAAQWRYEWCEYRRVITDYPETPTASIVGTQCDNLRDYYVWRLQRTDAN